MIVFVNGPFGVGKTTAASLLVERLENAVIYDPESIGFVLRRLPTRIRELDDYQDSPLWRRLVPLTAKLLRRVRRVDLVMPMTVWRRDYFKEISAGLRRVDGDLRIYQLTVTEDELQRRIESDRQDKPARTWRLAHVKSGMAIAEDPLFGEKVPTDGRMPGEVVEELLHRLAASSHKLVTS